MLNMCLLLCVCYLQSYVFECVLSSNLAPALAGFASCNYVVISLKYVYELLHTLCTSFGFNNKARVY